jgi:hypothetical protein
VKSVTPRRLKRAYLFCIALEHRTRAGLSLTTPLEGSEMLSFDSYRDVLSEHARGHHLIWSAWIVLAVLAALMVVFA